MAGRGLRRHSADEGCHADQPVDDEGEQQVELRRLQTSSGKGGALVVEHSLVELLDVEVVLGAHALDRRRHRHDGPHEKVAADGEQDDRERPQLAVDETGSGADGGDEDRPREDVDHGGSDDAVEGQGTATTASPMKADEVEDARDGLHGGLRPLRCAACAVVSDRRRARSSPRSSVRQGMPEVESDRRRARVFGREGPTTVGGRRAWAAPRSPARRGVVRSRAGAGRAAAPTSPRWRGPRRPPPET